MDEAPSGDAFADVLRRAQAGSPADLDVLYRRLVRPVAGYLRARGVAEVEDLTSDVFVAVLTGLGRFRGDEAQLRSWVLTIAHRRAVDHWRRSGRRAPTTELTDADGDLPTVPSAEEGALERIGGDEVARLLALLTVEQREVLALRIVADLTVEQVAQVVGRRPGAVKALQRRGLETIRARLAREAELRAGGEAAREPGAGRRGAPGRVAPAALRRGAPGPAAPGGA